MNLKVVCQKNEAGEKNAPGPFIHCRGKTPGTNRLRQSLNMSRTQSRVVGPKHFDHFMMDVIQARGLAVFEEGYGISKVLDGERCQDGFTAVGF